MMPKSDIERSSSYGRVTIPGEKNLSDKVLELARRWGADAIRDSDGTALDNSFLDAGYRIYSIICLVRADQKWAKANPRQLACKYLMSRPVTASSDKVEIKLLAGYFVPKHKVNYDYDPKKWWEVIDRTTGAIVDTCKWSVDQSRGTVVIELARPFHVYTVSFLSYQTWDSTSMYNHMMNNWHCDPVIGVDPYLPETRKHLSCFFDQWLEQHEHTDVVRLTTLAYHFTIDSDENGKDKYRDWMGYTDCVSVKALEDFEREKGYRLRPEDFVDEGFYNSTNRVPSKRYLDWMDFIQKFVLEFGKELVDKIHVAGKKAAIFWGDHWIGAEFYSDIYQKMGIDTNVGACENGVALRRVSDIPGDAEKEVRLYPYMFPDVFNSNCDPVLESQLNWAKIRRALLRKSVDRIGYGGYVSLAMKNPQFVEHVAGLTKEFRTILDKKRGSEPYTTDVTVAVLDAWGKLRSWINHCGPDEKFNCNRPDTFEIAGSNVLECLSGLPVQVKFISFDDIRANGLSSDIDVIINDGSAGTAWSGGHHWKDPVIVSALRRWVHNGGGFIGVTDPSACEHQGRNFQLFDVLGVEKETGVSIGSSLIAKKPTANHFVSAELREAFKCNFVQNFVYCCDKDTQVLRSSNEGHVLLAAKQYGGGRSVYLAGLPYTPENSRLLLRSILWAACMEKKLLKWFSTNPIVDCAWYPESGNLVVANSSNRATVTTIFADVDRSSDIEAGPFEIQWHKADQMKWSRNV